jgi:hypothetical protein
MRSIRCRTARSDVPIERDLKLAYDRLQEQIDNFTSILSKLYKSLLFFPKVTKFGKYTPFPAGKSRPASMSRLKIPLFDRIQIDSPGSG